jgi:hypothetical protein
MLALFSGQGCDISQPYGNRRVTKGCSQAHLLMSYISLHNSSEKVASLRPKKLIRLQTEVEG